MYEYLGNLHFQQAKWQISVDYFHQFIAKTPLFEASADALYKRIEGFLQLQNFDSVLWYSRKGIEQSSGQ